MTNNELADKVLSHGRDQLLTGKVADSFRKWAKHSPTKANGPKQFWDALAGELDCEDTVSGAMLTDAAIERFIGYGNTREPSMDMRESNSSRFIMTVLTMTWRAP
jgi:hypothetical protein